MATGLEDTAANPLQNAWVSLAPVNMRAYIAHLLGSRTPITEQDFSQQDIDTLRQAIDRRVSETGKTVGSVSYGQYDPQNRWAFGEADESALSAIRKSFTDPAFRLETTLGTAGYRQLPDGSYIVEDRYNFNAPSRASVENALSKERMFPLVLDALRSGGVMGLLNLFGNVYGATDDEPGTPVSIRIPPASPAAGQR